MKVVFKLTWTTFRSVQNMGPLEPYSYVLFEMEEGKKIAQK